MTQSKRKESGFIAFVEKNVNKLCIFSYILGVLGFLALPYQDFSENHYHSENALLTGMQRSNFNWDQAGEAEAFNSLLVQRWKKGGWSSVQDDLIDIMGEHGITAHKQGFSIKSPLHKTVNNKLVYEMRKGTNVYGFIRAGRASSTESLVLNIPISVNRYNYAIGLALALGNQIRSQQYWAKDIVLLMSDVGCVGAQAWLQSYYDVRNSDFVKAEPLEERTGAVLGAVILELTDLPTHLNVEVVGNNGQLPNLDLFNLLSKLSTMSSVRLEIGGIHNKRHYNVFKNYKDALRTTMKMMAKQAKGFSEFNHAAFLQYNIQCLTIQGRKTKNERPLDMPSIARIVEGIFRSLNNLLEKLHHSYFFYLISETDRFISIVLYMPPLGLILLAPTLKALCLWLKIRQAEENDEESAEKEEADYSLEDLIRQDKNETVEEKESVWMGVFYIVSVAHILGVLLYFSPTSAPSWSAMYGLSADDSLFVIFLSTYFLALPLPFVSLFRFSDNPKVYDLLRIVALVQHAMILGCTAVMNFSLGMVVAVASAPFITPINPNSGRLKLIYAVMVLLASPLTIALAATYTNRYLFNENFEAFWESLMNVVRTPYQQSLMGHSWNYQLACLLLYPNWMLFWFLAVAETGKAL